MVPSGKVVIAVGERFWTFLAKKATFLQKSRKIINRTYFGMNLDYKSERRVNRVHKRRVEMEMGG